MRADTFAPGTNQALSPVSDSDDNSNQHFASVSNRPGRVTFEPRTAREQARDVGALIIDRLQRSAVWPTLSVSAIAILYSMCFDDPRVVTYSAGLIVRRGSKEIAPRVGLNPRSAYQPMRELEEAGLVRRLAAGGNRKDSYEVIMPPPLAGDEANDPADEEPDAAQTARAVSDAGQFASLYNDAAAQVARATSDASLYSDASADRKPEQNPNLARAISDASLYSDTACAADAGFSTGNPLASLMARAGSPPTAAITASAAAAEGDGAEGKPERPEIKEISKIAAELEKVGLSGEQAIEYAGREGITLRTAIALRMEMMQNRKWPWIIPIALGILNGTSKRGLSNTSLREADRELGVAGGGSVPASASTKPAWMTDFAWKRWGSWSAAERESRLYAVASKYSGNSTVMSVIQAAIAGKSLPPSWLIDDAARVPAVATSASSLVSSV